MRARNVEAVEAFDNARGYAAESEKALRLLVACMLGDNIKAGAAVARDLAMMARTIERELLIVERGSS
jgi:hypothetical protein